MRELFPVRRKHRSAFVCGWGLAAILAVAGAVCGRAQGPVLKQTTPQAVVLDRVVAVVNNQPILASDVDNEMRMAVLNPSQGKHSTIVPSRALEQLISRALIEQQIREEDAQAVEPTQAEVEARLMEIRSELPACVHFNCATEPGWKAFLAAHELTPDQVESYLRSRMQILHFIELRFRQGIRISPEQISTYYDLTLLPQYAPGEAVPPLEQVAPRIEEILLEQQVNALFGQWLDNLRQQGHVEVLDPALEPPATKSETGKEGAHE